MQINFSIFGHMSRLAQSIILTFGAIFITIVIAAYTYLCVYIENKIIKFILSLFGIVVFLLTMICISYFALGR